MLSPTKGESRALGPNPTQQQIEQWRSMPKSWRKEMEQEWNAVPDKAKQYVHERESQALEGIRQYKTVADRWGQTLDPYKQWFDHYKIDPHEAFGRLATSHIILKYGKPEDRAKYAQMLINDYGLQSYLQQAAQNPNQPLQPDPNAERLNQLESEFERLQREDYERKVSEKKQAVVGFFNDPQNEFAMDLKEDILTVLELGAANTLEQAYEIAKWQNPAVRERLLARQIEEATKPPRNAPSNIRPSSVPASPTDTADESMDDTMRQTLSRINSR
jgi:hypothetical protein